MCAPGAESRNLAYVFSCMSVVINNVEFEIGVLGCEKGTFFELPVLDYSCKIVGFS